MPTLPECDYTVTKFTVNDPADPDVTGTLTVNGVTFDFQWTKDLGLIDWPSKGTELVVTETSEAYLNPEGMLADVDDVEAATKAVDADIYETVARAREAALTAARAALQSTWSTT